MKKILTFLLMALSVASYAMENQQHRPADNPDLEGIISNMDKEYPKFDQRFKELKEKNKKNKKNYIGFDKALRLLQARVADAREWSFPNPALKIMFENSEKTKELREKYEKLSKELEAEKMLEAEKIKNFTSKFKGEFEKLLNKLLNKLKINYENQEELKKFKGFIEFTKQNVEAWKKEFEGIEKIFSESCLKDKCDFSVFQNNNRFQFLKGRMELFRDLLSEINSYDKLNLEREKLRLKIEERLRNTEKRIQDEGIGGVKDVGLLLTKDDVKKMQQLHDDVFKKAIELRKKREGCVGFAQHNLNSNVSNINAFFENNPEKIEEVRKEIKQLQDACNELVEFVEEEELNTRDLMSKVEASYQNLISKRKRFKRALKRFGHGFKKLFKSKSTKKMDANTAKQPNEDNINVQKMIDIV